MKTLGSIEEEIYHLAREFLKKTPLSSMLEIVDYINNRTTFKAHMNKNKIEQTLKELVKMKLILPGTKLVKQQLLKNPNRRKIYGAIRDNPGININDLMRTLSIGTNQVLWHLKFLKKFDCVRTKRLGNQKAYFLLESDPSRDEQYFYLRNEKVQKILEALKKDHEELNASQLRIVLGMNYNTVKKYLDILTNINLVRSSRHDNTEYYCYNTK